MSTREGPILARRAAGRGRLPLPDGAADAGRRRRLRFSLAPRGYRMAEVDLALERLAAELADRDRRIGLLEAPPRPAQRAGSGGHGRRPPCRRRAV
jgi:DivIVA domain-containing protein